MCSLPPAEALTFAEQISLKSEAFISGLCKDHPELRSVAVVFDWGEFNSVCPSALWGTKNGHVRQEEAHLALEALPQTAKVLKLQTEITEDYLQHVQMVAQRTLKEAGMESRVSFDGPETPHDQRDQSPATPAHAAT